MIPGSANPLLLTGSAAAGGYAIERSIRLNSSDSAYLARTPSVAGSNTTLSFSTWVKRVEPTSASSHIIFSTRVDNNNRAAIAFSTNGNLAVVSSTGGVETLKLITNAVYRDLSAWYHIFVAIDTTQATPSDKAKLYVNGTQVTSFSTETYPSGSTNFGAASQKIGVLDYSSNIEYFNGYLADVFFIDGQALDPTSFGEFDANGIWQPIEYTGTYGTNGFHLPFSDNSTAAALGTDTSGAGNNWTVNNISVAAGAGNDSLVDTPTSYGTDTGAGGEVRGNYCTLNPLAGKLTVTLSDGNLTRSGSVANNRMGTIGMSSGKWYWEVLIQDVTYGNFIGVTTYENEPDGYEENYVYNSNGGKYVGLIPSAYGDSYGVNDIIGVAYDADTGTLTCYKNGVSQGQLVTGISKRAFPLSRTDGTGQHTFNFGQRPFAYPAPSGYKALCTTNLPAPVVAQPSTVMDVLLWTGNGGGSRSFSGLNFSPDLAWVKTRSVGYTHVLWDSVRGAGASKELQSDSTNAEGGASTNLYGYLSAFNSDGFSSTAGTTDNDYFNRSATTYVGWCWDAGSSTVTNTQGSITSTVRANPSAGFSIVTYTGNGSAGATVGHGLGVAPSLILFKRRDSVLEWNVYSSATGNGQYLVLNSTQAAGSSSWLNNTTPSSTVFTLSNLSGTNASSGTYVAYCFAPVAGYSSFGSYTGNGSADGPFVYTGFRPRWVMIKSSSIGGSPGYDWIIHDTSRSTYNLSATQLIANSSVSENLDSSGSSTAGLGWDILSNGFKIRTNSAGRNQSGQTYIYAAFAEHPFQYARAR